MRAHPPLGLVAAVTALALGGCALPQADGQGEEAPRTVKLAFSYESDAPGDFVDQTLTITNTGSAAGAPTLEITPLDAAGDEVPGVEVVTAFGTDRGEQAVPAYTEVTDVLKFKGKRASEVEDVEVTVTDPGTLADDLPPANDLRLKRFDVSGKATSDNTLGSVLVKNSYDKPIRVKVVGLEFASRVEGEPMRIRRITPLAGPIDLEPGEKLREKVPEKYRLRFYGSVRAFLAP